jgi:peptidoglycan/LPS O-acetylase OafA/YrhL
MPNANEETSRRQYFPALDGLRAIAALMVLSYHFCQYTKMRGPWALGQTGVDLFFVLSGFLITSILLEAPEKDWREVRLFYLRRTLRIFPLYYAVLIGLALAGWGSSFWFWIYLQNIPFALAMRVAGPGHFWSLAVEEQFYLLWPFLVFFLPRQWLTRTLWAIVGMALVFRILIDCYHSRFYPFVMFSRFDGLAAGALLATYYRRGILHHFQGRLVLLMSLSAAAIWLQWWKFPAQTHALAEATKFSLATAFYVAVIGYTIVSGSTLTNRLLSASPLRFIGRVSYGLYVYHLIVYYFALSPARHLSLGLQFIACFGGTFLIAVLSWYGYERWFILLKNRITLERKETPAYVNA